MGGRQGDWTGEVIGDGEGAGCRLEEIEEEDRAVGRTEDEDTLGRAEQTEEEDEQAGEEEVGGARSTAGLRNDGDVVVAASEAEADIRADDDGAGSETKNDEREGPSESGWVVRGSGWAGALWLSHRMPPALNMSTGELATLMWPSGVANTSRARSGRRSR